MQKIYLIMVSSGGFSSILTTSPYKAFASEQKAIEESNNLNATAKSVMGKIGFFKENVLPHIVASMENLNIPPSDHYHHLNEKTREWYDKHLTSEELALFDCPKVRFSDNEYFVEACDFI